MFLNSFEHQKIDSNARMLGIFMDSVDKSAFYIYVFLRTILARLDAVSVLYALFI